MRAVTLQYTVGPKWRSVSAVHSVTNQGPNRLCVSVNNEQKWLKAGNAVRFPVAIDVMLYSPGDTVAVCEQDDTY